jgi:hypothetical protein
MKKIIRNLRKCGGGGGILLSLIVSLLVSGCDPGNETDDKITLAPVPLSANVVTTSVTVSTGEKYHRQDSYYNGKLCRTIQHSTLYDKNHQEAINLGFTACKVCKPDETIEVDK